MGKGKREADQAEIDPSIYDYDAAFDAMQAVKDAKKNELKREAQAGKPRYMEALLKSADTRKRDQLRARDKFLQKEREAEGEEFADKEKFVTAAYKRQQAELRILEEEEKKKEEEEAKKRRAGGMSGFYRSIINADEERHRTAMTAAADAAKGGLKDLSDKPKEKTDAELAAEINAKGGHVVINDDGQVADKRQLLSSGLNITAKPGKTASLPFSSRSNDSRQGYRRGENSELRGTRERQTQMIEEQIEQAAKRAADEEAEERRRLEHAAKSKKTSEEISSAKERYLQRKKAAAAAAAASTSR